MVVHFQRLFAYNSWANREVVQSLSTSAEKVPECIRLLAHILAAEYLWYDRLIGAEQRMAVWPQLSLSKCSSSNQELAGVWQAYLSEMDRGGLAREISYVNTKGETHKNLVSDVLTHLHAHGAYHRGQIAARAREAGLEPAYTDYIHCVRQGFLD